MIITSLYNIIIAELNSLMLSNYFFFYTRLRLKKEFDDFKKHPEYSNFVREECISSSSSSDDDEERGFGKEVCSLSDHYRRSEEEDLDHMVPRGLWSGGEVLKLKFWFL